MSLYQSPQNGFQTFLVMWATQFLSVFGSLLTFFTITIWLSQVLYREPDQQSQLAFALAALSLIFALSNVFLSPLAGVWADRHNRQRIMISANLANGCLSLILLLLLLTQLLNLGLLLTFVSLFTALGQFHYAAFETSYTMLVPEQRLSMANGMVLAMYYCSGVLAPLIASGLLALTGTQGQQTVIGKAFGPLGPGPLLTIGLDAASYFLAAFALLFLKIPNPSRLSKSRLEMSFWTDFKQGLAYLRQHRVLLWLSLTGATFGLISPAMDVFGPLLVKFNLRDDWTKHGFSFESAYAVLGTASSLGGVVGSLLLSTWGGLKKRRVYGLLVPMLLMGLVQFIYGLSPWLYLTALLDFIYTSLNPISVSHNQRIWQSRVPPELQGRVFAVRRMIGNSSLPLGTILAGWLGGIFNPGVVLSILGLFLALYCSFQLFNTSFLRLEEKVWQAAEPNAQNKQDL
jgi:DHA3 family macrolide efflux protein-like MFS transporter